MQVKIVSTFALSGLSKKQFHRPLQKCATHHESST